MMLGLSIQDLTAVDWLFTVFGLGLFMWLTNAVYNFFFHPLAHIPGPFFARISGIPSWYHAYTGKRHMWIWQQFQIHGSKIRTAPNEVQFCDPEAFSAIHSMKANVRKSHFYTTMRRNSRQGTALNTVDVAEHARLRKLLNLAFTEKSVRAASEFIINHVERWNQLLVEGCGAEWSAPMDFSAKADGLTFDIIGELSLGKSFDIKEPGENPLKAAPHSIDEYMRFIYPIGHSPFLGIYVWLKPRGLDLLFQHIVPPAAKQFFQFVQDYTNERIALQKEQSQKPEGERRKDMFYFLSEARDPDTGVPVYDDVGLRAQVIMLLIAGSDTTSIVLTGLFFFLTCYPHKYQKLVSEIRTTFSSTDEIIHGPKLSGCTYLRACLDEAMRISPTGPSELPRQVLPGGLRINGEYYPPGTVVGIPGWANWRNQEVYGDPEVFRPERWIVDETTGVTKEEVARSRANFHPFSAGPGSCVGKNLVMVELMITVARTLHRLDVRRAPGSTLGGGAPELGWGARDSKQFQVLDGYISVRRGPEVQFRKRVLSDD